MGKNNEDTFVRYVPLSPYSLLLPGFLPSFLPSRLPIKRVQEKEKNVELLVRSLCTYDHSLWEEEKRFPSMREEK